MRALTLLHRWLGVPFAPLFAMWFASGIVMHFVPYPTLSETERVAGMVPIDVARVTHGPSDAVAASGIVGAPRVRLLQRTDDPVYVVSGTGRLAALRADDLTPADVRSADLALTIAADHAKRRGLDAAGATVMDAVRHDQWTVAGHLDPHRPLWRVVLRDGAGTELYVSSVTGEVVAETTRRERWWGWVGSVPHWLYPTALRAHRRAWTATVWVVSGLASIAAIAGLVLGAAMLIARRGLSPAGRWHAWHHALGLVCAAFVLTWIVTGWLSVDDGAVVSTRKLYGELHALSFPALTARPVLRSALIVVLCGCGLAFSLTGCVIAWRRLRQAMRRQPQM
jgi:PepSY-associated TM region